MSGAYPNDSGTFAISLKSVVTAVDVPTVKRTKQSVSETRRIAPSLLLTNDEISTAADVELMAKLFVFPDRRLNNLLVVAMITLPLLELLRRQLLS
jgi:hypothetical protein